MSKISVKRESPPSLLYSSCLCSIFFTLIFFYSLLLILISFFHLGGQRMGEGKGGGLSPVGKVKLPATELYIKPLLWQLKLSPALCPQCSFLLFLHLPLLFPSYCRGNSFIMCYNYYICCCTCSPYLGVFVGVDGHQMETIEPDLLLSSSHFECPTCLKMF